MKMLGVQLIQVYWPSMGLGEGRLIVEMFIAALITDYQNRLKNELPDFLSDQEKCE